MAVSNYEIINKKKERGDYLSETDLLDLIAITKIRSPRLYKKLVGIYEFIEDTKFKGDNIKNVKQK